MKNIKFVVRVCCGDTHATKYVKQFDRTFIEMTADRKLALVMGRFTAEDAVKTLQNRRHSSELVAVRVNV